MLTTLPEEKYGQMTTRQHYEYIAKHGQDYDPYTSAYGILKDRKRILDESAAISKTAMAPTPDTGSFTSVSSSIGEEKVVFCDKERI